MLELELHDGEQKHADTQLQLNRSLSERKKFETDYLEAFDALHEMKADFKSYEEKLRSTSGVLVKKEEEIRHERELNHDLDASRKGLEQQLRDLQVRVEESEEFARKESRRVASKYEGRVSY